MAAKPFESRIQDLVYNVEVGVGLVIIKYFLYLIFIFMLAALYIANQFQGFKEPDAMEYAQLARQYAETGTLRTQVVRPATLWYLIQNKITRGATGSSDLVLDHPDILHPPVYPMLMGMMMKITGFGMEVSLDAGGQYPAEKLPVIANGVFTLLTGLFLFLSGKRLFDRQVAFVAVTLFYLSNVIWENAISGLPISLVMLLGSAAIHFALVGTGNLMEQKPVLRWLLPLLVSLLCSILAFHTLYAAAVLVAALVLYIAISPIRGRWLIATAYLVLFVVSLLPWIQRNQRVSGSAFGYAPYTILHDTGALPKQTLDRNLAPDFKELNTGKRLYTTVGGKFGNLMPRNIDRATRELGNGVVACFFLVSLFHRFNRPAVQVLRWGILLGLISVAVVGSLFSPGGMRVLTLFWPVVLLYGTAYFYILRERLNLATNFFNGALTAIFIGYNALQLIITLMPPKPSVPYPPFYPPYIQHVANFAEKDDLVCSDMPWGTAWYGKRSTLLMPTNVDQFYDINDFTKRVAIIYFTPVSRNQQFISELQAGGEATWFNVQTGNVPPDFPLREGFLLGGKDQVFLTDSQRLQKDRERREKGAK